MEGRDCRFHFKEFLIQALAETKEAGTARKWGDKGSLTLEPHLQTPETWTPGKVGTPHTQGPQALGPPLLQLPGQPLGTLHGAEEPASP